MNKKTNKYQVGSLKENVHKFLDLSALSTSSVAPAFSIAASYGVIAYYLGFYSIMGIIIVFPIYLFASLLFRRFNKLFPNAGASYHWGNKIVSKKYGSFQAWVITLAYFFSIPPIIIPAGEYTDVLLYNMGIINYSTYISDYTVFIIGSFWVLITIIASILGARPTARLTELFLFIEIFIISLFIVIALFYLPGHIVNSINFKWYFNLNAIFKKPYSFMLAFPIIATIMDGWEIDSYASEESSNKTKWPGTTGIIGFIFVFIIYIVTMTLMDAETPMKLLSISIDPLATWSQYIFPRYSFIMDIAVISSTASSLWLTTYILSRAWYAMTRDKLFPNLFGYTHKKYGTPWSNLILIAISAEAINSLMLFLPSLENFFAELLSISGIFLMLEFAIDSFTGIYLYIYKPSRNPYLRYYYILIAIIAFVGFSTMIVFGLITNIMFIIVIIILMLPAILLLKKSYK